MAPAAREGERGCRRPARRGRRHRHGTPAEAAIVAGELAGLEVPVVAVLGNHDHHHGAPEAVREALSGAGVVVLEGEAVALDLPGGRLGVAGAKGFGGGFGRCAVAEFGEPEVRAFAACGRERAAALRVAFAELSGLGADVRVALTHYAPTVDTLAGEPPELCPFLGGSALGEAVDAAAADLAVHGHAHFGTLDGGTPGGVPVRNVAAAVLARSGLRSYAVLSVTARTRQAGPAAG